MTFTIEDKRVLVLIVFSIVLLLFVYNGSALEKNGITVKLISNTDRCEDCKTVYNVCFDQLTASKITDYKFLFSDEISKEQNTLSSLKSVPIISYKLDKSGLCYDVTITATKSPFADVDNILCFKDICFKEFVWWNSTFPYKQSINISIITNVTDYQINISLNSANNGSNFNWSNACNGYFRFTDNNNNKLPYWIEYCNSTIKKMYVWVKGNFTTTNGTQLYLYYGNASISNESNGTATFIFYDDFNDCSKTANIWFNDSVKFSCQNNGWIYVNITTGNYINFKTKIGFNVSFGTIIQYDFRQDSSLCTSDAFIPVVNNGGGRIEFGAADFQGAWSGAAKTLSCQNDIYHIKTIFKSGLPENWENFHNTTGYRNGNTTIKSLTQIREATQNVSDGSNYTLWFLADSGGSANYAIDYFTARKYLIIEPIIIFGNEENLTLTCNYTFNVLDNDTIVHLTNVTLIGDFGNFTNVNSPFNSNNITNGTHNFTVSAIGYYEINNSLTCNLSIPITNMTIYLFHIPVIPSFNITNVSGEICCPDWNLATKSICYDNLTLYQEYNEYHCLNGLCENATAFRYVNCPYGCVEQTDNMGDGCISPNYQLDFMFIIAIVIILIIIGYLWKRK